MKCFHINQPAMIENQTTLKKFISFLRLDYSAIVFILSTLIYTLTLFPLDLHPFILYIVLLLNFSSFDRIGWKHIIQYNSNTIQIVGYRIIQHGYLILLGASLFHIDPSVSIAFLFSWYMGTCDLLYYIVGKEYNFIKFTNMYWLWWCPWAYFKIKKTGVNLVIWSCVSILISIFIICGL